MLPRPTSPPPAPAPPAEDTNCILHPFELADRICVTCGGWHCDACLVTPWGPRKGALCVACAIRQAGVRTTSGQAQLRSDREIRKLERQRRKSGRDEGRRPVLVSPVGLQKLDPFDAPPKKKRFRR